jgi:hypothetical protein
MRYALLGVVLTAVGCGGSTPSDTSQAGAGVVSTLSNDGFTAGGAANYQAGFVAGEEAAATLGPVSRSFKVRKVQFLFGGGTGTRVVTLRILAETGAATPGVELYSGDYQVTASDTAFQEIDLAASNVTLPAGSLRVSIRFQAGGLPSVAADAAITSGRNWIYASGTPSAWFAASSLGVTGDWIMRAEVVTL